MPATSSQAVLGAIPGPASLQPKGEGSQGSELPQFPLRADTGGRAPAHWVSTACSTHPFVVDGTVLGKVLVGAATPAQENHQRLSSPSFLPTLARAVL